MKICYFTCSSSYGGMEKIIIDTLNGIIDRAECSVIIPKNSTYINRFSNKVNVIEFESLNERSNPFLYLEIYKILKNYEIIHTHGAKATKIAYFINKILPFIHVATKHNIRKGKIFNKVKNVISVSSEVSKTITHSSTVLYFGIQKPLNIESEKNDTFTITTVGRLDNIKGFDLLIEQVSRIAFNFQLNIIGEGPEKQKLLNLIDSKNLGKKVFLLGFKNDIPKHLKDCHLQVISSLSEGLPLTLLEGIMNSPIIISTPVGGIVEVLESDYLVNINDFANKISNIYEDYIFYSNDFKLKHNHLKEKFDFDVYSNNLLEYYKEVYNG
ncbi:glycosyltransferase [Poseidonibacter ostreae]|uniref:Glycosyltransferase n=1 Tax=Poseidonibacter ostreae TaxID=2654171 RepID=A0A6L4WS06_9BACT|nr:glycosyltransferase [Poseidonibacter ostreae]KAB7886162.1 glycosyltransferase [Poseidonibacter ostreae]KAB7888578.1 glycosyltransferase [Poseidonibacter ostreae]